MRYLLSVLMLTASVPLLSQDDCDLFNIQELSAANLSLQAEIDALSCYAGVEMDGYRYKGVPIGEQCWFAENLRTTMYADGSAIPEVTGYSAWSGLSSGARCYYDNDPVTSYGYGRMYNWHAVDDTRGLCPTGWHVPTDDEWTALETYLGANGHSGALGTALKSTSGWSNSGNGTDDFGFSALPGGYRRYDNGGFRNAGSSGDWWSSSPSGGSAWSHSLTSAIQPSAGTYNARYGFSVRCLRDADFAEVQGCTDTDYLEYNASATNDDGSCSTLIFEGCTNPTAANYDAAANTDDGSCIIYGCTNPTAANYDAAANTDDGSCIIYGCMDQNYIEYNPAANTFNEGCSTLVVEGCTDPDYTEYNASANTDDGSCATLASTCVSPSMDGHSYGVVEIGDQCWFAENLRTTMYADGSAIPEVTDNNAWSGLSSGARCYYDNDPVTSHGYGRMYNWHAVDDTRGLCPTGWHVPTDDEWTALETYLGANGHSGTEGTALKSTSGWNSGGNGTDDFGFSALPGGLRYANNGNFNVAGNSGYWWSSSPSGGDAWRRALSSNYPDFNQNNGNPRFGFSVRCLRDAE